MAFLSDNRFGFSDIHAITGRNGPRRKRDSGRGSVSGRSKRRGLPSGWTLEKTPGPKSKYVIEKDKEDRFLRLHSVKDGFGLRKEISFDIRKYPYLSWWWKAIQLPKGGDIRKKETDDQAGSNFFRLSPVPHL